MWKPLDLSGAAPSVLPFQALPQREGHRGIVDDRDGLDGLGIVDTFNVVGVVHRGERFLKGEEKVGPLRERGLSSSTKMTPSAMGGVNSTEGSRLKH